jgi:fructan beta-fructosidase
MKNNLLRSTAILIILLTGCSVPKEDNPVEQHRPHYHFTPVKGWMNDPNGLVYYKGEYHLFYQHYPDSTVWGPMHWGHAVSRDLLHWDHLPIALYPDSLGMIFSGSAVMDSNNTSGLGTPEKPPLIAVYTYHNPSREKQGRTDFQYQGLAFSVDKGRNWNKYTGNPILTGSGKTDFRDPKVVWHAGTNQWIMILAVKDHVEFYRSPDLLSWRYAGKFGEANGSHGRVWECPDLFELPVENTTEKKWVLLLSINPGAPNGGSGTQYFIGQFNGDTFEAETADTLWLDYGKDNYAGVTWSNIPANEERRLFMGWMSNWEYGNVVPTRSWRSAMTIPRELVLTQTDAGLRLASRPAREFLHAGVPMNTTGNWREGMKLPASALVSLRITRPDDTTRVKVIFSNEVNERIQIGLDGPANELFVDRTQAGSHTFSATFAGVHRAPRASSSATLELMVFLDAASLEVFADGGTTCMTEIFFPGSPLNHIKVEGNVSSVDLEISEIE